MENYQKGKEVEKVLNVHNLIRANLYRVKELNSLLLQDYLDTSHLKKMTQAFWIHAIKEVLYLEALGDIVHKIRVKRFKEYIFMKKIRVLQRNAKRKLSKDSKYSVSTEIILKTLNLQI